MKCQNPISEKKKKKKKKKQEKENYFHVSSAKSFTQSDKR